MKQRGRERENKCREIERELLEKRRQEEDKEEDKKR
jgi:hypothetical protein